MVLVALTILAAALPQGEVDFEDLRKSQLTRSPPITPKTTPSFTPTGTLTPEEIEQLLEELRKRGLSGLDPADLANMTLGPVDPNDLEYPTDRDSDPSNPTCLNLYSPSSTCHNRFAVYDGIEQQSDGSYRFLLSTGTRVPVATASGSPTSVGTLHLTVSATQATPVPALTWGDQLVSHDVLTYTSSVKPQLTFTHDPNHMVWVQGDRAATIDVRLTWRYDPSYFDDFIPTGLHVSDVPANQRPVLDAAVRQIGLQIASRIGVSTDQSLDQLLPTLQDYFADFGEGPIPGRDVYPDDMIAIAYGRNGCCRHRAEAFVVTAQSLGLPAHMIVNEAHAFAEVNVPTAGWRLFDLGGCGDYSSQNVGPHEEIQTDAPVNDNLNDGGNGTTNQPPIATSIEITEAPSSIRRGEPFTLKGTATSVEGSLPSGVPITIYYNETKTAAGTSFCTTQTTSTTAWETSCTLPSSAPAKPLQLVARLSPATRNGKPTAAAFSDPAVSVTSATTLTLDLANRAARNSPLQVTATLRGDQNETVKNQPVEVLVDGNSQGNATTDAAGRARVTLLFSTTGVQTVLARFAGSANYDPSQVQRTVSVIDLTITLDPIAPVSPGTPYTVQGSARDSASALPATPVRVTSEVAGANRDVQTDATGRFSASFTASANATPGPHADTVYLVEFQVTTSFTYTVLVDTELDLQPPSRWHRTTPLSLTPRLLATSPSGSPSTKSAVPNQSLTLSVVGQVSINATTNVTGHATLAWPTPTAPGSVAGQLRFTGAPGLQPANRDVTVRFGTVALADVEAPRVVVAGSTMALEGRLTFDGQALGGEPLTLSYATTRGSAVTDAEGRFRVELALPENAPLGDTNLTLAASGVGFTQLQPIRFGHPTHLRLRINDFVFSGATRTLHPQAVSDNGTAVEVPFTLTVDGTPVQVEDGAFRPKFSTAFFRVATVKLSTPGNDTYAAASAQAQVVIVNPWTFGGLLLVVGGGITGYALYRRRQTVMPTPSTAPVATKSSLIVLAQPQFEPGVPPVWAPGEVIDFAWSLRGYDDASVKRVLSRFRATVTSIQPEDLALREDKGVLLARFVPDAVGEYTVALETTGGDGLPADRLATKIYVMPYFEAIEHGFRSLAQQLQLPPLPGSHTYSPRLVERALVEQRRAPAEEAEALCLLFEKADYDRATADRAMWLDFFRRLHRLSGPAPTGGSSR